MGFIAKGDRILVESGSGGVVGEGIYKREKSDGTFEDVVWGSIGTDFATPINNSAWTTYGVYKYLPLAVVRQVYSEEHEFDRNMRFDTSIRFSNTVTPLNSDISGVEYIIALVKGSSNESTTSLVQKIIDEYTSSTYDNVVAIGKLCQDVGELRAINIDVNDIKTYAGVAETTQDYRLPEGSSIYLVNIAMATNAVMESITSLSVNIYQQQFIEFYGNGTVAPGSIGRTEINPEYKAENAVSNHIIKIASENIVEDSSQNKIIVITPDELVEFKPNTIYYIYFDTTVSFNSGYISLGVYDIESEEYVPVGNQYATTISGTVSNKITTAVFINNTFTVKSLQ